MKVKNLLLLVSLVWSMNLIAGGSGMCGNNAYWSLDESGTLIISGSGSMNNYYGDYDLDGNVYSDVPWFEQRERIYKVIIKDGITSIGIYAFYECNNLSFISIPNSIIEIGKHAFDNCTGLTSVLIPNSVTSIGSGAFWSCTSLTSIVIPNSIARIEEYTFNVCSNLSSITIPSSVKSIGKGAFRLCQSLPSITIPEQVTNIEEHVFEWCKKLASVNIPTGVTSIGEEAFHGCESLRFIILPNTTIGIGKRAFDGCKSLSSLSLPNSVTSVGEEAFRGCESLYSIVIPKGIRKIESKTFEGCKSLKDVTISDNLKQIGDSAFFGCAISYLRVPNGVTSIGNGAFENNESLKSVILPVGITELAENLFSGCKSLESIEIPNATKKIGQCTFLGCSRLVTINIPPSVISLGVGAFAVCTNLQKINIPSSVTSIDDMCFMECSSLESLTIPNSVTSIGGMCFSGCSSLSSITLSSTIDKIACHTFEGCARLSSIDIPEQVAIIEAGAFEECENLSAITIPRSVMKIGDKAFFGCKNLTYIKVPSNVLYLEGAALDTGYDGTVVEIDDSNPNLCIVDNVIFSKDTTILVGCIGRRMNSKYTIPNSVVHIADYAFSNCENLSSVVIPNSVKSIGKGAFFQCNNLSNVDIPNSISTISDLVFCGCSKLSSITIPNSVCSIGRSAFESCVSINSINIPNSVTSIGIEAFKNCSSLKYFNFPENLILIEDSTFYDCTSLSCIYIPRNVKAIGERAFYGCSSLISVKVPQNVKSIGCAAFANCYGLETVVLEGDISLYYAAFGYDENHCVKQLYLPMGCNYICYDYCAYGRLVEYEPGNSPNMALLYPPSIVLDQESILFSDANNNNYIDADEKCALMFRINNRGKGAAENCYLEVNLSGASNGIKTASVELSPIAIGETREISIPIDADHNTIDGKLNIITEIIEPNGMGLNPFSITVPTKAFEPPHIVVADYEISTEYGGQIEKKKPFFLTFNIQNTQWGNAEDVKVTISNPDPANIILVDGKREYSFPLILPGEEKQIKVELMATNNYAEEQIPIEIGLSERYGMYAENKSLDITLNQAVSKSYHIDPDSQPKRKDIQLALMTSEVDRDIPISPIQNSSTLVLIIANEHYQTMPEVPYAINDGNVFKDYCLKTLGIPQENILYLSDAGLNGFRQKVFLLQKKAQARAQRGMDTHIIFYYTGHGMPDVNTQSAYLMPVDGFDENVSTGYKLDNLYQLLGQMQAKTVTVFLDACFSGVNRNDKALAVHKGARLTAKSGAPSGNTVVFAASQGNQTASVNDKEKHGLFTYCLLKKLKATEGDISLSDLANYLIGEVNMKSLDLFEKEQIPSVVASPEVESQWRNWKLK